MPTDELDKRSWWRKIFGRSLLKALIGDFFSDKNNAASVIAILLVSPKCFPG